MPLFIYPCVAVYHGACKTCWPWIMRLISARHVRRNENCFTRCTHVWCRPKAFIASNYALLTEACCSYGIALWAFGTVRSRNLFCSHSVAYQTNMHVECFLQAQFNSWVVRGKFYGSWRRMRLWVMTRGFHRFISLCNAFCPLIILGILFARLFYKLRR